MWQYGKSICFMICHKEHWFYEYWIFLSKIQIDKTNFRKINKTHASIKVNESKITKFKCVKNIFLWSWLFAFYTNTSCVHFSSHNIFVLFFYVFLYTFIVCSSHGILFKHPTTEKANSTHTQQRKIQQKKNMEKIEKTE